MTQKDKELLLKDLSAMLPYRVYISPVDCGKAILIGIKDGNPLLWDTIHKKEYDKPWDIEYVRPYLRPMSSMTEKEKEEFSKLLVKRYCEEDWEEHISTSYCIEIDNVYTDDEDGIKYPSTFSMDAIDWLNAHHFDYRGLIEKGLAIEAPKGMYNIKEK